MKLCPVLSLLCPDGLFIIIHSLAFPHKFLVKFSSHWHTPASCHSVKALRATFAGLRQESRTPSQSWTAACEHTTCTGTPNASAQPRSAWRAPPAARLSVKAHMDLSSIKTSKKHKIVRKMSPQCSTSAAGFSVELRWLLAALCLHYDAKNRTIKPLL